MKVGIHQPHYFPWVGYFDKIAKADKFILLDTVQLEKGSQMIRNRVISDAGEIKYITISADTTDFLHREYRSIDVKNKEEWIKRQKNALSNYYRKAAFYDETMRLLEKYWSLDYDKLCDWTVESIRLICDLLEIKTELVMQSDVGDSGDNKNTDLVLDLCKKIGADIYFSGKGGSVEYLNRDTFSKNGVSIVFQDFSHPIYAQCNTKEFMPGVSIIDMLFNCGIEETKRLFWENVKSVNEFEKI